MKRYKLLKDTPNLKAGAIFEEQGNSDDDKELVQVVEAGCLTKPWFAVSDIDNFDEWFEEVPEYKRRRVRGCQYYYIDDCGNITDRYDLSKSWDDYHYDTGNYGLTKKELEAKREYDIARQVLLDDAEGGKFVRSKIVYYVNYNTAITSFSGNDWEIMYALNNYSSGKIYFKDKESLEKSLEEHKEQWEIVRQYEMGEL